MEPLIISERMVLPGNNERYRKLFNPIVLFITQDTYYDVLTYRECSTFHRRPVTTKCSMNMIHLFLFNSSIGPYGNERYRTTILSWV